MRRVDDGLIDPEIAAELEAIDATLAGEPVDPRHAEIAELALLLVAGRPEIDDEFARLMDERVGRRFEPASTAGGGARPPRRRRGGWLVPLGGLATAAVGAVVAVAVLGGNGGSSFSNGGAGVSDLSAASTTSTPATTAASSSAASSTGRLLGAPSRTSSAHAAASPSKVAANSSGTVSTGLVPFGANIPAAPAPIPNGRKIIQSSQLQLQAAGSRIDSVAQELFVVVAREDGFVQSSNVTSGTNGYAQFQLSVPSGSLSNTMTALSELHYASVVSRTDSTQDVNGQYLFDQRQLGDARALRTSLLKQLAAATTQTQIDSLTAQIHDAEASIGSDEATLRNLNHQIAYSQVSVQVNAAYGPQPLPHHSGTFTLGKAAHDAGRVLTVAAGVALIALAALVPVALLAALGLWVTVAVRRRRREQALDLA